MNETIASVTLGTAGHIDHGKSALVHKLTGIDPDRLKEEQVRGMTIDLGYAFYTTKSGQRVGVIDVPGHEKFVKNMVTGASSIDIVILAVAADDGVMPQTREHLEIMGVMGIRRGIVALTKIDLVDREMVELASQDVEDLLKGTFLQEASIFPISSQTGEGYEPFIAHLEELIENVEHQSPSGLFRMPVQRAFSARGFGTVVTGVPMSGTVRVGDPVEVLPQGLKGKIRGMQAFGAACDEGRSGHRVALNIADVDYRELHRGSTVATPGYFSPTNFFQGRFTYFKSATFPLKNLMDVKVHAGTAEALGKVVILDRKFLEPGEEGFVQLRLQSPLVVAPGDCFLLRRHSPALSLGGGTVVELADRKVKRFKETPLRRLESRYDSMKQEMSALLEFEMRHWQSGFFTTAEMSMALGQKEETVQALLDEFVEAGAVRQAGRVGYIHDAWCEELSARVKAILNELHRAHPLKPFLDISLLRNRFPMKSSGLQDLLKIMEEAGIVQVGKGGQVKLKGFEVALDDAQLQQSEEILGCYVRAGLSPPSYAEIAEETGVDADQVKMLVEHLIETGQLKRIANFLFSIQVLEKLKEVVIRCARETGEVKIPLIKEVFPTTRKYLIPIMEYLDGTGLTRREGDRRFLRINPGQAD